MAALVQAVSGEASAAASLTLTLASTGGSPAGYGANALIVAIFTWGDGGTAPTVSTVKIGTTSLTADTIHDTGGSGSDAGEFSYYEIASVPSGQTSLVVTVTGVTTGNFIAATAYEFSGMTSSGTLYDKATAIYNGETATWTTAATATTSQAYEVAVGAYGGWNNATWTPVASTSGWTNTATQTSSTEGGLIAKFISGYQLLSSTGTVTYSGTGGNTGYWNAAVAATFKAATPATTTSGSVALATPGPSGSATVTASGITTSGSAGLATLSTSGSVTVPPVITSSGSVRLSSLATSGSAGVGPGTTAPSFDVASTGTYTASSTTNTIVLPSGLQSGDLMIIAVDANYAVTGVSTPHTTFTKLASDQASSLTTATAEVWYAYAAGTSGTSTDASATCTVTVGGSTYPCTAFASYSNAAITSPIDSYAVDATTGASGVSPIPCTAATTASANVLPVSVIGLGGGSSATPSITAPSGYTIRSSYLGNYEGVAIADAAAITSSGTSYGGTGWTFAGGGGGGATVTFGIAAAVAGGVISNGSAGLSAPAMSGTAAAGPAPVTTSGSVALPALGEAGTGMVPFTSTGSVHLAALGVSGTEAETYAASGSVALAGLGMSGTVNPATPLPAPVASYTAQPGLIRPGSLNPGNPGISSGVTSTGSAGLAVLGVSGTSAETYATSGSAALAALALSGSATVANPVTSTGSAGLHALGLSGTETEIYASTGSIAAGALGVSGSAAVANPVTASGSAGLASLGLSGSSGELYASTGSVALAALAPAGTSTVANPVTTSGSVALASLATSGSETEVYASSGSVGLAALHPSGAGMVPFTSTGSAGLGALATSGSAVAAVPVSSSGSIGLGALATAGLAGVGNVIGGTGTAGLAALGMSGTGQVPFTSTGSVGLAAPGLSGSATETYTASGGVSLAALALSGSETETYASSGSAGLASPGISGSATVVPPPVTTSGSVALATPGVSGSSGQAIATSGSVALAALAPSGSGSVPFTSTGSIKLGTLATSGSETETIPPVTTSGGLALAALAPSGTVAVPFTSSGSTGLASLVPSGTVAVPFTSAGSAGLGALATAGTASAGGAPVTSSGSVKLGALATSGSETEALPVTSTGSIALGSPGMSGSASAVTTTNPSWDQAGTYTLTFSDDFTGSSLDTTKWTLNWQQAGSGTTPPINIPPTQADVGVNGESAAYSSSQLSVSGSVLSMALTATPTTVDSITYPYLGCCITTDPSTLGAGKGFQQALGCFEARIYMPASGGQIANWPAWWLDGQTWPADGELDILEGLGGAAQFHVNSTYNNPSAVGSWAPGETPTSSQYAAGWHTFGLSWNTDQCDFYYDGILAGSVATYIPTAAEYLVFDHTTGWQSGPETAATVQIDWVRVWEQPTAAVTLAPMGTLTDSFPSMAETCEKWTGESFSVASNEVAIVCDTNYDGQLQSITQYNLTGSSFYAKIVNPSGSIETGMVLTDQAGDGTSNPVNALTWQYDGTDLVASITQGGTTTTIATLTYSATTHAYWKIAESGGNVTWSTSANGTSWTSQGTHTHTISVEALYVWFWTGNDGSGTLATYVSDVNGGTGPGFTASGGVTLPSLHPSGTGGPATHISGTGSISLPAANVRASGGQTGGPVTTSGSIALGPLSILRPPPPPPAPSTPGLAQPGYTTPGDAGLGAPVIYATGQVGLGAPDLAAGLPSERLLLAFAF